MSRLMKKYGPYLRLLNKASPKVQKALLKKNCETEFINCVCECAKNLLKGNVSLTATQKQRLVRRKRLLRKLVLKKTPLKDKRKIIQTGGFLGALLGPIVSILSGLFGQ
jgi:hypothetical protein